MVGSEGFRDTELGEVQELTDTTPEELADEDATETSVSKQVTKEGRKCRGGSAGKESDTRQSGRRVPITQICSCLP